MIACLFVLAVPAVLAVLAVLYSQLPISFFLEKKNFAAI
jgi:hypothetical protein